MNMVSRDVLQRQREGFYLFCTLKWQCSLAINIVIFSQYRFWGAIKESTFFMRCLSSACDQVILYTYPCRWGSVSWVAPSFLKVWKNAVQHHSSWLVNQHPPNVPPRNKGLLAGLIKGKQWLISPDHKALFLGVASIQPPLFHGCLLDTSHHRFFGSKNLLWSYTQRANGQTLFILFENYSW